MEKYSQQVLESLNVSDEIINVHGASIDVRRTSDTPHGCYDPRELNIRLALAKFNKPAGDITIEKIRASTCTRCEDLSDGNTDMRTETLDINGRSISAKVYFKKSAKEAESNIAIYMHGGSFIAGSAENYEMPCRFTAEKTDSFVYGVDYSLAPETHFPTPVQECAAYIDMLYEKYGKKVFIFSDSAGGAIALGAAFGRREKIAHMGLFYPCVDMSTTDALYKWDINEYEINPSQAEIVESRLGLGRADGKGALELMGMMFGLYFAGRHADFYKNPQASPIYGNLGELPPCNIYTSEFDGLRIQAEVFAGMMKQAGGDVKILRFAGVSHAFLDFFGTLPQAEAGIWDWCNTVNSYKA